MPMDAVSQTLAQQTSGSAGGEGFGQFFLAGQQNARAKEQINLARQRLELEQRQEARMQKHQDLLDPLVAEQTKSQNILLGQKAAANQLELKAATELGNAAPELLDLQLRFLQHPDGYDNAVLQQEYRSLLKRYPQAFVTGEGAKIKQSIEAQLPIDAWEDRLVRMREKLKLAGLTVSGKVNGFTVGPDMDVYRQQRQANELERLKLERQRLGLSASAQELRALDQQINALEKGYEIGPTPVVGGAAEVGAGSVTPGVTPAAGSTNAPPAAAAPRLTRVERPPTTGRVKELQDQNADADMSLRQLTDIRSEIFKHPNAFGPVGEFTKWKEIAAGLVNAKADATVSRIRQKAGQTFVSIARSLRPDSGNMSHFELTRLQQLGDLTALENVPSIAIAKADELISMQVAKKLRVAKELKQPIPDMVLKAVAPDDAKGLHDDGLLSDADLERFVSLLPMEEVYRLQNQLKPTP